MKRNNKEKNNKLRRVKIMFCAGVKRKNTNNKIYIIKR